MSKSKYTAEVLGPIIACCNTWGDVCRVLNITPATGSQTHIKNTASRLGLDFSHFKGQAWSRGKVFEKKPIEFYLVKGSTIISHKLKLRLIHEGIKEWRCEQCKRKLWRGSPIPLELRHINGIRNDNRIENLKILCPNCHAQTNNYSGKRGKTVRKTNFGCIDCGKVNTKNALRCKSCASYRKASYKINWPQTDKLKEMVAQTSYTKVAKHFGVSDNAVRKRIKNHK